MSPKRFTSHCHWLTLCCLLCPLWLYAADKTTDNTARPNRPTFVDRIVAVVNSEVITQQELDRRTSTIIAQLERKKTNLPPLPVVQRQVLERLVVEQVLLQYAKQTGIRVDDIQLDKSLERIAAQNHMSLVDFRNAIEKDGMEFAAFREEMRSEIIMSRLREREVDNKIVISESEIDNYLKSKNAGGNSEYQLAHILISVPENATPEEIAAGQSRVNEALSELAKGTDFAQVAAGFSDAEDALEGGLIGWKTAAQLPSLYVEALKTMKPGAVSNALRSSNGFHILKLTDKHSNAKQVMVDQTHVRHILIKPNEAFTESDVKNRLMQIKERLDNGAASFADMARQYSDDPSAAKGGDLGWISPGDTVPEFESTMNTLQPGQISEPVQTPFGWHLIEVVERRTQDMSEENARMQARQQIRIRKSAEAYEDWVRQLRDQAYVEYHLQDY